MRLAREAVEVRGDGSSKSVIWAVLLIAAATAGVYLLWQANQSRPSAVKPAPAASAAESPVPASALEVAPVSAIDLPAASPAAESTAAAVNPAAGVTPNPATDTAEAAAPLTAGVKPTAEAAGAETSSQNLRPAADAATDDATVSLSFRDSSWVRIRDSRNKVLLNGLVQAGKTESMTGVPPYTISLGRAAAVSSVTYQGQTVDLAPYTVSGGTAFFTLPLQPAPAAATTAP